MILLIMPEFSNTLILTIIAERPSLLEAINIIVIPGFLVVLTVLALLAAITSAIGKIFVYTAKSKGTQGPQDSITSDSLSPQEIAAVAATAHALLRTPVDSQEVASDSTTSHTNSHPTDYRILSIEKRVD